MPKKKEEPPPVGTPIPELEPEVELPEELGPVPEPSFRLALVHVAGSTLRVEEQTPPAADAQQPSLAPLREFDPCAELISYAKEPGDALAKRLVVVEREELQAMVTAALPEEPKGKDSKKKKPAEQAPVEEEEKEVAQEKIYTLPWAVRQRVQKERAARSRAKSNAARRRAIQAAAEAEEAAAAARAEGGEAAVLEGAAAETGDAAVAEEAEEPRADLVLVIRGYPSTAAELAELAAEGLGTEELVDLWAILYLAGQTVEEVEQITEEEEEPADPADAQAASRQPPVPQLKRVVVPCEAPDFVRACYGSITEARLGSDVANLSICTLGDCQHLAFPPEGTPVKAHLQDAVLDRLDVEVSARLRYRTWMQVPQRISVPSLPPQAEACETRLYHRMMNCVDASHHDVPLFLHCLVEQVERSLGGETQQLEDEVAMSSLQDYLFSAMDDVLTGEGAATKPRVAHRVQAVTPPQTAPAENKSKRLTETTSGFAAYFEAIVNQGAAPKASREQTPQAAPPVEESPPEPVQEGDQAEAPEAAEAAEAAEAEGSTPKEEEKPLLPRLDPAVAQHHLGCSGGACGRLLGGDAIVDVVQSVLGQVCAPGAKRSGLPEAAVHSMAQRQALQSRIHPFAPSVAGTQIEHMMLLHAFEEMLSRAQPERGWCLKDRCYRELIPRKLLARTLQAAFRSECFLETAYEPRFDCLLLALHHRSFAGRVLWHSWRGDVCTDKESEKWLDGLFTIPTYGDWLQLFGEAAPQPRFLLENLDAREFGHAAMVEKIGTPSDGSVIVVSKLECGAKKTFPEPSNAATVRRVPAPVYPVEEEEGGNAETPRAEEEANLPGSEELAVRPHFDAPAGRMWRFARVVKDGCSFGLVQDGSWLQRTEVERQRRQEAAAEKAAADAAAATAAAAAESGGESRPGTTQVPPPLPPVLQDLAPPFGGIELGLFWLALPGGARCTARMHHERGLPKAAAPTESDELPTMGVLLTYTSSIGQVIQVFSDGSVQLMWPLAAREGKDARGIADAAAKAGAAALAQAAGAPPAGPEPVVGPGSPPLSFVPGCPDDVEASRTVTPLGTVVRRLLSGRIEVFHADGTLAFRNPTAEEVAALLEAARRESVGSETPRLSILTRLHKGYQGRPTGPLLAKPSRRELSEGLPGHWVVIRPDGRKFGRTPVPPPPPAPVEPPPVVELPPEPEVHATGKRPGSKASKKDEAKAEKEKASTKDKAAAAAAAEPTPAAPVAPPEPVVPEPPLQELLDGVLVDDGSMIEYEIDLVPRAAQVDIQTQHKTERNAKGLTSFIDPAGSQKVTVYPEGTQVYHTLFQDGSYFLTFLKDPLAHIRCEVTDSEEGLRTVVECTDGTRLEVVPHVLGPQAQLVPVGLGTEHEPWLASHAAVRLICKDGASVTSSGTGVVEVSTAAPGGAASDEGRPPLQYVAHCNEGRLALMDSEGTEFELYANQTLQVTPAEEELALPDALGSPRCSVAGKAEALPGADCLPPPEGLPPPRLFVVYGDGEAEELLRAGDVEELLKRAQTDPLLQVVEEVEEEPVASVRKAFTVYRTRLPDAPIALEEELVAIPPPPDSSLVPQRVLPQLAPQPKAEMNPGITEYTRLVRYPFVTEETRSKFLGSLKQYQRWEAEQLAKSRAIMKPPPPKGKNDKKGVEKKKKGKKDEELPPPEPVLKEPPPAFVPGLKLTPYEHALQAVRFRARQLPPTAPSGGQEVPEQGVPLADGQEADDDDVDAGDVVTAVPTMDPVLEEDLADPVPEWRVAEEEEAVEPEDASPGVSPDEIEDRPPSSLERRPSSATRQRRLQELEMMQKYPFQYWRSTEGLDFLEESGGLDPNRIIKERRAPPGAAAAPEPVKAVKSSPWNPRLIGEPEPEAAPAEPGLGEEPAPLPEEQQRLDETMPLRYAREAEYEDGDDGGGTAMMGKGSMIPPFTPQARLPIVPEYDEPPRGPHKDKKSSEWNVYGERRTPKAPVSQAHISINEDYLAVEGETDRRVRTCSIAHKKNSAKAPSVSTVRKTGVHMSGLGSQVGPKELLEPNAPSEEHWKVTSTLQGLGNSNQLVEVMPGACRFGPLRLGSLYRMAFFVRNLDVDVTRFNVSCPESDFVTVKTTPGLLAPGIAQKVMVEVAAIRDFKIDINIIVKVKAHVVKVPVHARIYDIEEYDRLDAESFALHGFRIGRHRKKDGDGDPKPPPVELVEDEVYCAQVMGDAYLPPPLDFGEEAPPSANMGMQPMW